MYSSKVVIELRCTRRIPKRILEQAVERFADQKKQLIQPFKKYDPAAYVRVWYEDRSKMPAIKVLDILPKTNPFKRIFKKRRDSK